MELVFSEISVLLPLHRVCDGAYHNWESVFVGEDAAAGEELIHEGAGREQDGCLVRRGLVQELRRRDLQLPLYCVCELHSAG